MIYNGENTDDIRVKMKIVRENKSTGAEKLIRYRWAFAALVFIVCVLLKLHGSSIGMFNAYLPTVSDPAAAQQYSLIGKERYLRSDEWVVQTPAYFSQNYNGYSLYSDKMGIYGENMIIDYYAPVISPVTIGKPLNWGYIMFGNETGLSWYWCGLVILIFMTSFEMFRILTEKDLTASLLGMLMVGLSPAVQWWMSPHIPIVYMYAMALFSIGYYLFASEKGSVKWLMTVLAVIALTGFIFSIFPAIQVIAGIVVFSLLCSCLARDRINTEFKGIQLLRVALIIMAVGSVSLAFVLSSKADFAALLGTSYPGSRLILGGNFSFKDLFTDISNALLAVKEPDYSNCSELADFIHLGPICMIIYLKIRNALKASDDRNIMIGNCLFILILIEYVFMFMGFPEIIAKMTLFMFNNRMKLSYGWTAAIFTVWCIYIIWKKHISFSIYEKVLIPLVFMFCCFSSAGSLTLDYLGLPVAMTAVLVMGSASLFMLNGSKTAASLILTAALLFTGIGVNPVSRGISPVTNHPISGLIQEIRAEDPDAKWISEGGIGSWVIANFAMANGAEIINGTTFYPVGDYGIIDPDNLYMDEYNRYLNEAVVLEDIEYSRPELLAPDLVYIHMSFEDLAKLGVSYVITDRDLSSGFSAHGFSYELLLTQDAYSVYRIGED